MVLGLTQESMIGGYLASCVYKAETFKVTGTRMRESESGAIGLNPGRMNRDLEIGSDTADGPRSRILKQVENGQAVRMSVLYHLLVGRE